MYFKKSMKCEVLQTTFLADCRRDAPPPSRKGTSGFSLSGMHINVLPSQFIYLNYLVFLLIYIARVGLFGLFLSQILATLPSAAVKDYDNELKGLNQRRFFFQLSAGWCGHGLLICKPPLSSMFLFYLHQLIVLMTSLTYPKLSKLPREAARLTTTTQQGKTLMLANQPGQLRSSVWGLQLSKSYFHL